MFLNKTSPDKEIQLGRGLHSSSVSRYEEMTVEIESERSCHGIHGFAS